MTLLTSPKNHLQAIFTRSLITTFSTHSQVRLKNRSMRPLKANLNLILVDSTEIINRL